MTDWKPGDYAFMDEAWQNYLDEHPLDWIAHHPGYGRAVRAAFEHGVNTGWEACLR